MREYTYEYRMEGIFLIDMSLPAYYQSDDIISGYYHWVLHLSVEGKDKAMYDEIVLREDGIIINRYYYDIEPIMIKLMIGLDLI